ncbi:MAG: mucoidy inhibitor MuiA family protein, partial [Leptospiraceae bacterium]|nr:mucoidy inhibitor MuiA family protein [Leptospiraceae bacterium]
PAYNIIGKEQDKADVEYLADIHQETGEDWDNVKVSLSTSEPKKSSTRPKVRAIEVFSEGGKTKKTFFSYESKSEESTVNTSSSTEVEKEGDLEGSIQEGAGGFIFRSSERANIKSKKESSRITISKFATELKTGLMTVPFKQRLIYTGGDLYNKISFPLLAGKAAIYKNSGYIGKILLPYTPSGSKVKISMGIENDIRVFYRKENSNFTDGFVKSKKVFDKTNIITIESFSKKSEEITIYDRIPVSEISDVDVELDKENTTQGFKWKGENEGILFWKIKIAPNEKKEIKLRFKIKAPEGAGLNF